jgi:hypothetical protein
VTLTFNHDFFVQLFRERPQLAPELLRRCAGRDVVGERAELASIDLSQVAPIEYRADALVVLRDAHDTATHAIVVEVQTTIDRRKGFTWPVYVTVARANLKCPVTLLVIAPELAVARWASMPLYIGGGFTFAPCVLSLDDMPDAVDDETAHELPELVLLAALGHPSESLVQTAYREIRALPEDTSTLYLDQLLLSLPEPLRSLLMRIKGYEYQSDFARQYFGEGRAEGRAEGRVDVLRDVLAVKFGVLPEDIEQRLRACDADQHRTLVESVLAATSLDEVLAVLAIRRS